MPVAFGHIKKVFVDKETHESNVWLVASSGVYMLPYNNVAPEYRQVHINFLDRVHSNVLL